MSESPLQPPPDHLSERSAAFWEAVVADWCLDVSQLELLRRLCEAMDTADQARAVVTAEGFTICDRYGQVKPHPAVNIERDARIAVARLTRQLDLEPEEEYRPPRRRGGMSR